MLKKLKKLETIDSETKHWIRKSIIRRNLTIFVLIIFMLGYFGIAYRNYMTTYELYDVMSYFIDWNVLEARIDEVIDEDLYVEEYDWAPFEGTDDLSTYDRFHLYATQLILNDVNSHLDGMMQYYNYIESNAAVEKYDDYLANTETFYASTIGSDFYLGVYSFEERHTDDILDYAGPINVANRLFIDLRDNPGGYMVYAFEMIDLFLEKDIPILSDVQYGIDGNEDVYEEVTLTEAKLKPKEIVILVDEYTASSAEIVTYALNAHLDNVTIVGQNTYGKGISTLTFDNYYGANITVLSSYFNMYNRDGSKTSYQNEGIPAEIEYVWKSEEYDENYKKLIADMNRLIDGN
ncbi:MULTISPECIES: S41 family peptidase [unclassified Fusibacter]|uniref:S41 family peptidase n=1 Tax=unclassified Fusibacter TaxID=2624464 RepID=UPI00101201DA|nr:MULTISPECIES: S41 family peptidase [unclassified Fusibacter]MCK8059098.1 S41 family peptidase [Fusibacter sp. A2]NPE22507.1 hypothetical protein [Fusibacter sp. A1]RXV60610.1 hypothetical protein DWB64_11720 [Fusibacter sp. A1]